MAFVEHCQTAAEVRANARRVLERRRLTWRKVREELNAPPKPIAVAPIPQPTTPFVVPPLLQQLLEEAAKLTFPAPSPIRIKEIQHLVACAFKSHVEDMKSARRTGDVSPPRHVAMVLCKLLTRKSLPEIGRHFGGRDHTTVLSAVRKYAWLAERLRADLTSNDPLAVWVDRAHAIVTTEKANGTHTNDQAGVSPIGDNRQPIA